MSRFLETVLSPITCAFGEKRLKLNLNVLRWGIPDPVLYVEMTDTVYHIFLGLVHVNRRHKDVDKEKIYHNYK